MKKLKGAVRRIGWRLGLSANPSSRGQSGQATGTEMPSCYYDQAFNKDMNFQVPFYKSSYYPTWLVIVDRLRRYGCRNIFDVGCGPGQFAALLEDSGFVSYTGLDFSTLAVKKAQERTPRFQFRVGDVRDAAMYRAVDIDAIICMEVLEHIEEDFAVISCFPLGTRCLMTVPNFPWRSHVRHFASEGDVIQRYGPYFDSLAITRIKGVRADTEQFYLLDGLRNTFARGESDSFKVS